MPPSGRVVQFGRDFAEQLDELSSIRKWAKTACVASPRPPLGI